MWEWRFLYVIHHSQHFSAFTPFPLNVFLTKFYIYLAWTNNVHIFPQIYPKFIEKSQKSFFFFFKIFLSLPTFLKFRTISHNFPGSSLKIVFKITQSLLEYKSMNVKLGNCACVIRPITCNLIEKLQVFTFIP